jgi:transcriptional regulator with XRE-family HTH domain
LEGRSPRSMATRRELRRAPVDRALSRAGLTAKVFNPPAAQLAVATTSPADGRTACGTSRQLVGRTGEGCTDRAFFHGRLARNVVVVDNRAEVREFLTSRRAKVTAAQAGMPDVGQRRVPGLRRGEVAALAGVSVEYYAKLERGALAGVSASVLDGVARALQLDDAERAHLFHLAHAADGTAAGMRPRRRPAKRWTPRPTLSWVLDRFTGPAIVRNGRMDLLACNQLGRAMHASLYEAQPGEPPNFAQFTFLQDAGRTFYPNWDEAADTCVAILRTEAGRDPHDKDLHDLVGELSTRSGEFRRRWATHNVRYVGAGVKLFHHDLVGDLQLGYESVDMLSDAGLTLTLYAAEPGSATEHALDLLGSWTSTEHPAAPDRADH